MTRCIFKNNYSPYGAIFIGQTSTVRVEDCQFFENRGLAGGALRVFRCETEIRNCIFDGNSADIGGAISTNRADLQIVDCEFHNNRAITGGGAVYTSYPSTVVVERCLFTHNAGRSGGVGSTQGALLIFHHCTLAANSSEQSALLAWDEGTVRVEQSIIASSLQGQAASCNDGFIEMRCCDVFGNAGGDWTSCIATQYDGFENICLDPRFRDPARGDYSIWPDSPCAPKNNPMCGQIGVDAGRSAASSAPDSWSAYEFFLNVEPNPVFTACRLSWNAGQAADVVVRIFDMTGRLVRELPAQGRAEVLWDRRDEQGRPVASGVYAARAVGAGGQADTRILLSR